MTAFILVVVAVLLAVNTIELARLRERVEDLEGERKEGWYE